MGVQLENNRFDFSQLRNIQLAFCTLRKGLQTGGRYATDIAATPGRRMAQTAVVTSFTF